MADEEALDPAIELFCDAYRHQMEGELSEAAELYRQSIETYSHYNLGRIWEMKHDFARALASYQMAAEIGPRYTMALTGIRRLRAMFN